MAIAYRPNWGVSAGLLLVALLALSFPVRASAGTITVTTTSDQLDAAPPCSLREAINTANQDVDSGGCTDTVPFRVYDTINLPAGDYSLSRAGVENANVSGDLDVTESLGIFGAGAQASRIDGNGATTGDRVLEVGSGTLTISGLTVHDGLAGGFNHGGGIAATGGGNITLTDSTVSGNTTSRFGGGIAVLDGGTATLTNSTVSGNTATEGGGGVVASTGNLTLTRSTVSGNTASASGSFGGGIDVTDGGTATLTNSTVSGNTATGGGGIFLTGPPRTLNITNSTLSGNQARASGGGLSTDEGTINLRNVTVKGNVADANADGSGDGGGLHRFGTATVNLRNTILAGNLDGSAPVFRDWSCNGGVVSEGYNLFSSTAGCAVTPATGDQTAADPGLAPLANNGGPTLTHALLSTSPAINTGNPATPGSGGTACPATDQRGVPRSLGGRCDKGAYERVTCHGKLVNRVGTGANDTLIGTAGVDGILALGGNDTLFGRGSGDGLCGNSGDDSLSGEAGPDFLDGGAGTDTCNGGTESDQAVGCETISSIP